MDLSSAGSNVGDGEVKIQLDRFAGRVSKSKSADTSLASDKVLIGIEIGETGIAGNREQLGPLHMGGVCSFGTSGEPTW